MSRSEQFINPGRISDRTLLDALLGISQLLVVVLDCEGRIQLFNRACEEATGYTSGQVLGRFIWSVLIPEDEQQVVRRIAARLDAGEADNQFTNHWLTSTGDKRLIHWRNTVLADEAGNVRYFVGTGIDVSDQKQAEREAREYFAELTHVTRIGALGEVTAGLAHETSQPLTAISAMAEAARMMLEDPEANATAIKDALGQIALQSERAREIIEQLRTFLRKDRDDRIELHSPQELIDNVLTLLSHELDVTGVTARVEITGDTKCCAVNRVQIEQVLFNLIKNAIDAMRSVDSNGDRGRTLMVSCCRLDGQNLCRFVVADTGPGLAEEHMKNLFHPFFTTKREGLGQGLSICRTIVQHHGGEIRAANRPGGGAVFEFTVPYRLDP